MEIISILGQSLSITLFVISMMLVIEYVNVLTSGIWSENLKRSSWKQVILGAALGVIPGCLGAYTAVSLYVHNILNTGALVAAMIATSGDEAFFMFSVIPQTAVLIILILFVVGIASGLLVNALVRKPVKASSIKHFKVHGSEPDSITFNWQKISAQFSDLSATRVLLVLALVISLILVGFNFDNLLEGLLDHEHVVEEHFHPRWVGVTFSVVLGISLFIVITVSNHFLEEHLLNHIIKKHLLRIFLWTFITLLALHFLHLYLPLDELIHENLTIVLLLAVLIGVIPESGPHLVFILLYVSGDIPLSILLASSIVQDGHGSLPLLAESPIGFLKVKALNVAVGLVVGGIALYSGM